MVVPELPRRLATSSVLEEGGAELSMSSEKCFITFNTGQTIPLRNNDNLYFPMEESTNTTVEWHERYGHLPLAAFHNIPLPLHLSQIHCAACSMGRASKPPSYSTLNSLSTRVGDLVYSDLCGPMALGGSVTEEV